MYGLPLYCVRFISVKCTVHLYTDSVRFTSILCTVFIITLYGLPLSSVRSTSIMCTVYLCTVYGLPLYCVRMESWDLSMLGLFGVGVNRNL